VVGATKPPDYAGVIDVLRRKLKSIGCDHEEELLALSRAITVRKDLTRGANIAGPRNPPKHLTVLLAGLACLYETIEDGSRQIYAFQHPGDFCDLHRYVLPEPDEALTVGALTDCSIGIIHHKDLDQALEQHSNLGLALWRATMLEASISRERLLNVSRRPALQRTAHLLCELLARREAVGINSRVIPLTQIDLADAAGLSTVHVNRIIHGLRKLGALSVNSRTVEIVNRERLARLARFDGLYLNMPEVLSHWQIRVEAPIEGLEQEAQRLDSEATLLSSPVIAPSIKGPL
jgi:CRP-like cAMP-binding protein